MQNLISLLGMFVLLGLAWLMSENRRAVPWRVLGWGLALQLIFGFLVLRWPPGANAFLALNDIFNNLLAFSREGALFVFNSIGSDASGPLISLKDYLTRVGAGSTDPVVQAAIQNGTVPGFVFAFQVLTTIIFFSALLSVLYYLGVMQKIVLLFAHIMNRTMGVSGAESLSNAANIFVGQTEAPLVVRPYLEKMTRSELMAIMVGGFSNTAGGVLGAYVLMLSGFFPNIASHLIAASILSAPAAFMMAKLMVPERDVPLTKGEVRLDVPVEDANVLDAAANGTSIGWQLAINVGAMLVSFVALVAMLNWTFGWVGGFFHDSAGLWQFNLMAGAALAALLYAERRGCPPENSVWWTLLALLVVTGAARAIGVGGSSWLLSVGLSAWLPLFLLSGRSAGYGPSGWATVGGVLVAANVVYGLWGPMGQNSPLTIQLVLGWLHWPIAFVMGVPAQDCLTIGKLLGEKLILTEFGAYLDLSNQLAAAARGEGTPLDPRSIVIVSYALCGFANVASIGIQIGGIAPLAPSRRQEIAQLGLKAMVGGALATFFIACVAGVFYTGQASLGIAPR